MPSSKQVARPKKKHSDRLPEGKLHPAQGVWRLTVQLLCAFGIILALVLLAFVLSQRFIPYYDEGIYIHGAERILAGQTPYKDWFVFTGPGTYWLFAALFRIVGPSLSAARWVVSIEIGVIGASIFSILVSRLRVWAAAATTVAFLAILIVFQNRLYVNHRWDSTCCLLIAAAVLAAKQIHPRWAIAAGLFVGCAAVCTPPTGLVALAMAISIALTPAMRRLTVPFVIGMAVSLALAGGVLAWQGSLGPMLQDFRWASQHYANANRVAFGFEPGFFTADASLGKLALVEIPTALVLLVCVVAAVAWIRRMPMPPVVNLLVAATAGLVLACYPRWASNQLLFAVPTALCALAILAERWLPSKTFRAVSIGVLSVCAFAIFVSVTARSPSETVATQLGTLKCSPRDQKNIEFAMAAVQPGEALFVYPYEPIWYSLTGGVNTTTYDFLQPGMMTRDDEAKELTELQAHPPEWILWHSLPPQTIRSIWPNSDPATFHFSRIEDFIRARYSQVKPPDPSFRYAIAMFHRNG